ncbi:ABC transporter permease [Gulosibacter chungangensis]|uniref:Proline/glycine betaine ABC transporter permease n=1 Tax=Gulosibacter chungangensis TaxID=979746 RepID=A0A7J5B961_9MICO|nr:proline/glycine betaine ABC transporter permease [Gulosibacter chungangensis]KAB1641961.1 proline/glycine betaine ABC transporter permease [Gulosibacter chungangensis]
MIDINFGIPFGDWVETGTRWLISVFQVFFDVVGVILKVPYDFFYGVFSFLPNWLMMLIVVVLAILAKGKKGVVLAVGSVIGMLFIVAVGQWDNAMRTLSLVLVASILALIIAIPTGIWAAKSERASRVIRPILDFFQTMPAMVYLIPALLLFGVGVVPGIFATVIFSLPPGVRMTELGIRGVDKEVVEAGRAFGATPGRILRQIELPLALPSIMAGVNQVIMLSLSMVVIAGMVGAAGLGQQVTQALQSINLSLGFEAGLSVVVLAMILDRLTGGIGTKRKRKPKAEKPDAGDTKTKPVEQQVAPASA